MKKPYSLNQLNDDALERLAWVAEQEGWQHIEAMAREAMGGD